MKINLVGAFLRNHPFGTEIAFLKGLQQLPDVAVTCIDPSYDNQHFDFDADFTVVFKWIEGKYRDDLTLCSGKKVVFQPDDQRFPHIMEMMRQMRPVCDYALTFDANGAKVAEQLGYLKSQKLIVTADPTLYRVIPDVQKDIDVAFVGSLSGGECHRSRAKMCQIVSSLGLKTSFVNGLYDIEQLNLLYNRAKVVLNHATDVGQRFGTGYGYQCRHFEAGFAGAFVLSNEVLEENEIQNLCTFRDEQSLAKNVIDWVSDDSARELAQKMYFQELNEFHAPYTRGLQMVEFLGAL